MSHIIGRGRYARAVYPKSAGASGGGGSTGLTLQQALDNGNFTGGNDIEMSTGDSITDETPGAGVVIETQDNSSPAPHFIQLLAGDDPAGGDGAQLLVSSGFASSGGSVLADLGEGNAAGAASGSFVVQTRDPGAGGTQGAVRVNGPGAFIGLERNASMPTGVAGGQPGIWASNVKEELIYKDFNDVDHPVAYAEFSRVRLSAPQAFADGVPEQIVFDVEDLVNPAAFGNLEPDGAYEVLQEGLYLIQASVTLDTGGTGGSGVLIATGPVNLGVNVLVSGAAAFQMTGNWIAAAGDEVNLTVTIVGASGNITSATMLIWKVRGVPS